MLQLVTTWALPALAVGGLALLTLGFAVLIGRWIDAQSNTVLDEPRHPRRHVSNHAGDGRETETGGGGV
jgi:hypothetical protein